MNQQLRDNEYFKLSFKSSSELYSAFMPFIRNGGIFFETKMEHHLGDTVLLQIELPDDPDIYKIKGKVVWVTPRGAQGGMKAGIGVQLSSESESLKSKIENLLAGYTASDKKTDTM